VTFLQRLLGTLLRVLLVCIGVVFAAILLAAGIVFTLVLLVWSLLRGRRPRVVRFRVDPRAPFAGMRRGADQARGEVVDIEAREVPDAEPPPHLRHDKR
jgi:hypothetical protein